MKTLLQILSDFLSSYLPDWLGFDKLLHFTACFLISVFGLVPAVFAAGLAIGKEIGDYFNKDSGWCWRDLIADGLGIAAGLGLHFIVKLF
jgi:uncharacterized protein YfiM (DUF2279 family)